MSASRRQAHTRPATPSEAQAYLSKAEEFLRAGEDALALQNYVAATGNAVHAGIAAADAISASRAGVVWKGEHSQAPAHVETAAGADGSKAAGHLRRLVPLKNRAEYDPDPIRASEAKAAVTAASRLVRLATTVVGSQTPPRRR